MRRQILGALLAATVSAPSTAWSATFSDDDFPNGSWPAAKILDSTPGASATFMAFRVPSGGTPLAFRQTNHSLTDGSMAVSHLNLGAVYDPLSEGGIAQIDFSFDVRFLGGSAGTSQVTYALSLEQGGSFYQSSGFLVATGPGAGLPGIWLSSSFSSHTADDFTLVTGPGPAQPDFSAQGSPITLGYQTSNGTTGASSISTQSGIDNWTVSVTPSPIQVPSVGSGGLLVVALLCLASGIRSIAREGNPELEARYGRH